MKAQYYFLAIRVDPAASLRSGLIALLIWLPACRRQGQDMKSHAPDLCSAKSSRGFLTVTDAAISCTALLLVLVVLVLL